MDTNIARFAVPLAGLLLLGGCGNSSLGRTFGLVRDTPDEFAVATRAPLSMPPDYTLRPPQPGAARPQDQSERSLAESALVPAAALGSAPVGVSPGQAALVRDAGGGAPGDIRQRVDRETRDQGNNDSVVDKVLFWRKPNTGTAVVNPTGEQQRLQQNSALGQPPVAGDTPIIQDKRKSWFSSLFSWL